MSDRMDGMALFAEMGCLTGDTLLKINRGGGSREYTIQQVFERFKTTWDARIPTKIRAYKEDHIGLIAVNDVIYSGVKPVYKLKLANNTEIQATEDHEFMTDVGWVPLNKLCGKKVMIDTTVRHKSKPLKKKAAKPRYNLRQVGAYHPYAHETTSRGKLIRRVEVHRLVYDAALNGLGLEDFLLATFSRNDLEFTDPKVFHIHHKDHNHKNNVPYNLEKLTKYKHLQKHGNRKHFGHGVIKYSSVVSIDYIGEKPTYDLKCEHPYHNFVANGIVVHNCGKSGALINILRLKYGRNERVMKTLILSPLVTLFNWKNEFKIHSYIKPEDVVVLSKGTGKAKAKSLIRATENLVTNKLEANKVVIVNYEALLNETLFNTILEWGPEVLVLDESHMCKTHNSKRTKKVTQLADRCKHKYLMTGTPILNSVKDIYSQYRILDGGETFGKNYFVFQSRYLEDENAGWSSKPGYFPKLVPRVEAYEEMQDKIYTKAIRVLKSECLDLPPLIKKKRLIQMGKEQKKYYEEMKRDFVTFVKEQQKDGTKSGAVIAQLAVTKALRLQQITAGFVATDDGETIEIADNPRLKDTKQLLEELTPNHKVIVWCAFRKNYTQIGQVCKALGIEHCFITGEMNLNQKQEAMDAFNKDTTTRVCIANRRAGGIGINLVSASYSIVYSRNFNLADELQSEARNHRGGSEIHERIVKIDLCAEGTIDEYVLEALQKKQKLSDTIIDLAEEL